MRIFEKYVENPEQLSGRLGYFLGSFDPLHEGHVSVVEKIFSEQLCENILVYCVNGHGTYKNRSDFRHRTDFCAEKFRDFDKVTVSYLSPQELQKKLAVEVEENHIKISDSLQISAIIGSDIVKNLYRVNENPEIELSRRFLLKNYMSGLIIPENFRESIACAIALPANDFIVALREDDRFEDIPSEICGKKVRAVIEVTETRRISSSKIRSFIR